MPPYFNFKHTLTRWASKPVTCPLCLDSHTLRDYHETHVPTVHPDVDAKLSCIFCLGRFTWTRGDTRSESVNVHRLKCMKGLARPVFKVTAKRREPHENRETDVGYCVTCDEPLKKMQRKTLRGRVKNERWGRFYESHVGTQLPIVIGEDHVAFSEESGLGNDIHPIFKHFQRNKQYRWYHVMVKAAVWKDFERNILGLNDVFVVPYGCLCDGHRQNATTVADRVHHRHMILVVHEKSRFLRVWRTNIKINKRVKAKLCIKIQSEDHLSNVLYYVSNPKAHCDGIVKDTYDPFSGGSHYSLERHMYPHAKLAMATLFRGGLQQYVKRRALHRDPTSWFEHVTVRQEDEGYHPRVVAMRHLGIPLRGCHLPLAKNVRFSNWMTLEDVPENRPFLWMYGENQLVLLETGVAALEQVPLDTWRRHQREQGNVFMEALDYEEYVLGSNHVKTVMMLKRFQQEQSKRNEERERGLESEMMALKEAWNKEVHRTSTMKDTKAWEEKERGMMEEIHSLRVNERGMEEEITSLKDNERRMAEKERERVAEITSLKEQINTLKKEEREQTLKKLDDHAEKIRDTENKLHQMTIELETTKTRMLALKEKMDHFKPNKAITIHNN